MGKGIYKLISNLWLEWLVVKSILDKLKFFVGEFYIEENERLK